MAIEIGSLIVQGKFGQPGPSKDSVTEAQMRAMLDRLRHEMGETIARQLADAEQRMREG